MDPEAFESGLPCSLDGSVNGCQHWSMAFRNENLARRVNVAPSERPQDFYGDVGEAVRDRLAKQAARPLSKEATDKDRLVRKASLLWTEAYQDVNARIPVDRSTVKGPVMTIGYGATKGGFTEQLVTFVKDKGLFERAKERFAPLAEASAESFGFEVEEGSTVATNGHAANAGTAVMRACHVLGETIWTAMSEEDGLVPELFTYRTWMQEVAKIVAEAGVPLKWTVPGTGFVVEQLYYERTKAKQIEAQFGGERVQPVLQFETDDVAVGEQVTGIAPNWTHAMDSAHLMLTVKRAEAEGIDSFLTVHDCYACCPGDAEHLSQVLRGAFYDLYTTWGDPVDRLRRELSDLAPNVTLPDPPTRGGLQPDYVFLAEWMFG